MDKNISARDGLVPWFSSPTIDLGFSSKLDLHVFTLSLFFYIQLSWLFSLVGGLERVPGYFGYKSSSGATSSFVPFPIQLIFLSLETSQLSLSFHHLCILHCQFAVVSSHYWAPKKSRYTKNSFLAGLCIVSSFIAPSCHSPA